MSNPFPKEIKINHHHINNIWVIPIPQKLHVKHNKSKEIEKHRNELKLIIEKMFSLDLNLFLEN